MLSIISGIIAIAKAVPIIDGWLQLLVGEYSKAAIARMTKENFDAVKKAVQERDQRDLEKAVGHPDPGMPSNDSGAEIVDDLPPNVRG